MLSFGGLSFDADRRLVCGADGVPLHLTPKAFDLLHILVSSAPRVVPKSELHARLWPDTFVTDAALTALIKELRRVLDDRDRDAPLIKTAHGVGYALDAPVGVKPPLPEAGPRAVEHWLVGEARRYALDPGSHLLGRDVSATVWIHGNDVSRRHARITIAGDRAVIEDLGSKNGTQVGATRLEGPCELADGDEITVGGVHLIYRRVRAEASTVTGLGA